jgi:hypothetical protein
MRTAKQKTTTVRKLQKDATLAEVIAYAEKRGACGPGLQAARESGCRTLGGLARKAAKSPSGSSLETNINTAHITWLGCECWASAAYCDDLPLTDRQRAKVKEALANNSTDVAAIRVVIRAHAKQQAAERRAAARATRAAA